MGDVVNLRAARKRKGRDDAAKAAEENRAKFGRSGAEKKRARSAAERLQRHLDGHRRDGEEPRE